ncbi:uncharacterized protein LOC121656448 [Melanotaenia boesemani]|uniref:uncharacterized protein LOC121656448 n=1 Tax=Melanotaenia boesemani TaxID=1250792 RepID=UPI001C053B88|nr:uncharacterized protein LOC121656448 [Melanotaenia boesemani]
MCNVADSDVITAHHQYTYCNGGSTLTVWGQNDDVFRAGVSQHQASLPPGTQCVIHKSTSCLFHLLLLTELLVHSSSHPVHSSPTCRDFISMNHQIHSLANLSKKLHDLSDDELKRIAPLENRLESLPKLPHSANLCFMSLQVDELYSQLYVYSESFRFHVDWLKTAKENDSLPFEAVEGASRHLRHLSDDFRRSLQHINQEVPQLTAPCFPAVQNTFDVNRFAVEISERLHVFCHFLKPVLRYLQIQSNCKKH